MAIRRSSLILIALGVLALGLAAGIQLALVPSISKLPSNLNVTNHYTGTGTLLNAAALQSGDLANVIAKNVPVAIDRHSYVSSTKGAIAIAHDDFMVHTPGGAPVQSNHIYALDRKTLDTAPDSSEPAVEPHNGLTIGLPIHPDPDAHYQLYDSATRTSVPLTHTGSATVAGRDVLTYTADASGPLADQALLSTLPAALPKAQLAQLAPALPADVLAKVTPEIIAALPDPVPVQYTVASKLALAADKTLGTPADGSIDQEIIANISTSGKTISLMPVLAMRVNLTQESIKSAADTAASTARLLYVVSIVAPAMLLALGLALVGLGVVRRHSPSSLPADSVPSDPVPTG
ncbi:porin PorA family protein [Nocardia sp. NPDC004123]